MNVENTLLSSVLAMIVEQVTLSSPVTCTPCFLLNDLNYFSANLKVEKNQSLSNLETFILRLIHQVDNLQAKLFYKRR